VENYPTTEEELLRAILRDKAVTVKDLLESVSICEKCSLSYKKFLKEAIKDRKARSKRIVLENKDIEMKKSNAS